MSVVRVPTGLYPMLRAPLALRGLCVTHDDEAASVVVAASPVTAARWLALVDDATSAAEALDRGADDVALITDHPVLLAARIARLAQPNLLRVGPLAIDRLARNASRDGRMLALLPREYAVLLHLAAHADTIVSRPQLRAAVWGRDFDPGTNVIEVHISRVRAALDRDAAPMLLTERGRGYRLASAPGGIPAIAGRRRAS